MYASDDLDNLISAGATSFFPLSQVLGAIAVIATGRLSLVEAWVTVDISTIALLFGLMVISAQFRLGGFYGEVVRRITARAAGPERLLAWVIVGRGCAFGAPGKRHRLSRHGTNAHRGVRQMRSRAGTVPMARLPQWLDSRQRGSSSAINGTDAGPRTRHVQLDRRRPPAFNRWQSAKGGIILLTVTLAAFLFTPWPRDVVALAAAAVLLLSRRMASREMLGLVDWRAHARTGVPVTLAMLAIAAMWLWLRRNS